MDRLTLIPHIKLIRFKVQRILVQDDVKRIKKAWNDEQD